MVVWQFIQPSTNKSNLAFCSSGLASSNSLVRLIKSSANGSKVSFLTLSRVGVAVLRRSNSGGYSPKDSPLSIFSFQVLDFSNIDSISKANSEEPFGFMSFTNSEVTSFVQFSLEFELQAMLNPSANTAKTMNDFLNMFLIRLNFSFGKFFAHQLVNFF